MSGRQMMASRTYMEMRDPRQLRPAAPPKEPATIERATMTPAAWRELYVQVGRDHHWVDRLPWSEAEIAAYLADTAVSVLLLRVGGTIAGYFELRQDGQDGVEIAYFGLLRAFQGRGLGGHLLTYAVERAWELNPQRVWLHTSTLDHSAALPNYMNRGFTIVKREGYIVNV
jgi:GNAT superfamily N-acetyltransferase